MANSNFFPPPAPPLNHLVALSSHAEARALRTNESCGVGPPNHLRSWLVSISWVAVWAILRRRV